MLNGEKLDEATLEITVDGYNAPITGRNFVDNVKRGVYTNSPMRRSETAVLGSSSNAAAESIPLKSKPATRSNRCIACRWTCRAVRPFPPFL